MCLFEDISEESIQLAVDTYRFFLSLADVGIVRAQIMKRLLQMRHLVRDLAYRFDVVGGQLL